VDNAGRTTVDVFEGTVEVRSDLLREEIARLVGQKALIR